MKPELSQEEFAKYESEGNTMLWAYNTLYKIRRFKNGRYCLSKVYVRKNQSMGVSRKGYFYAMTPAEAFFFMHT